MSSRASTQASDQAKANPSSFLPLPSAPGNEVTTMVYTLPLSSTDGSDDKSCSTASTCSLTSFLGRLRSPTSSNLVRKRTIKRNPSQDIKRCKPPRLTHNPKAVPSVNSVMQYSEEPFMVSCGRLFCQACREEVGFKKSVINNHIQHSKLSLCIDGSRNLLIFHTGPMLLLRYYLYNYLLQQRNGSSHF